MFLIAGGQSSSHRPIMSHFPRPVTALPTAASRLLVFWPPLCPNRATSLETRSAARLMLLLLHRIHCTSFGFFIVWICSSHRVGNDPEPFSCWLVKAPFLTYSPTCLPFAFLSLCTEWACRRGSGSPSLPGPKKHRSTSLKSCSRHSCIGFPWIYQVHVARRPPHPTAPTTSISVKCQVVSIRQAARRPRMEVCGKRHGLHVATTGCLLDLLCRSALAWLQLTLPPWPPWIILACDGCWACWNPPVLCVHDFPARLARRVSRGLHPHRDLHTACQYQRGLPRTDGRPSRP